MEYQKGMYLLDNTPDQLSKLRTKNWIEIDDQSRGGYNTNSDIRFKTTVIKSSLFDYGDTCMLVKGTITINGAGDDAASRRADEKNKDLIFKKLCSIY